MTDFLNSCKKGSRSIRKILKDRTEPNFISNFRCVDTFCRLTGIEKPEPEVLKGVLGLWTVPTLPNNIREFIFKIYNNFLGLNRRTINFGGTTSKCTFCTILGVQNPADDIFLHLFYDCPTVKTIQFKIQDTLSNDGETYTNDQIKAKWFGLDNKIVNSSFRKLIYLTMQFHI